LATVTEEKFEDLWAGWLIYRLRFENGTTWTRSSNVNCWTTNWIL